jgi:hypothetical protein
VVIDDLQVVQFLHLIMTNQRISGVIDTLAMSVVLILGRFTLSRKAVLRSVADALRPRGFVPVQFDFERPASPRLHRDRHHAGTPVTVHRR